MCSNTALTVSECIAEKRICGHCRPTNRLTPTADFIGVHTVFKVYRAVVRKTIENSLPVVLTDLTPRNNRTTKINTPEIYSYATYIVHTQ